MGETARGQGAGWGAQDFTGSRSLDVIPSSTRCPERRLEGQCHELVDSRRPPFWPLSGSNRAAAGVGATAQELGPGPAENRALRPSWRSTDRT